MAVAEGKLFSEALKDRYKEEFEIAGILDTKANNMITISSAVATLLFGFGTFFIDKMHLSYQYSIIVSVILIGGISLNILSMIVCIRASRIQKYCYVMTHEHFFTKKEELDLAKILTYKQLKEETFYAGIIKDYLNCIKENSSKNNDKAKKIEFSQILFTIGIFTIIAIAIFLLVITNSNNLITSKENKLTNNLTLGNPFYQQNGKVSSYQVLNVSNGFTTIELSLSSNGFVKGRNVTDFSTISYSINPSGTIYNGHGQGFLRPVEGIGMSSYSLKFIGQENDVNGKSIINGTMYFSPQSKGNLIFLDNIVSVFRAQITSAKTVSLKSWQ